MCAIFGFEVEYDQYSDSAKSCKRVHIPNIAIIGFGNIPNELAGICQPNRNMTLRRPPYPSNANSNVITRDVKSTFSSECKQNYSCGGGGHL